MIWEAWHTNSRWDCQDLHQPPPKTTPSTSQPAPKAHLRFKAFAPEQAESQWALQKVPQPATFTAVPSATMPHVILTKTASTGNLEAFLAGGLSLVGGPCSRHPWSFWSLCFLLLSQDKRFSRISVPTWNWQLWSWSLTCLRPPPIEQEHTGEYTREYSSGLGGLEV